MANSEINKRPPLGVMPRFIFIESRIDNLEAVMFRYMKAGIKIPDEWEEEYYELLHRLKVYQDNLKANK